MHILQIAGDTLVGAMPQLSQTATATAESLSVWDLALKGGWIMIVLLILSILAVYIYIERLLLLRQMNKPSETFLQKIRDYIREGKLQSAKDLCQTQDTPGSRMIAKGIERLGRPTQDIMTAIENVGNIEVAKLEKNLPALGTIASGAPMIGFLGTVTGMVRAFYDMATAGSNVDVALLSSGIYEALVTTVGGLIVGIIALFMYNHLVGQIDKIVTKSEAEALEFMDLMNEPVQR